MPVGQLANSGGLRQKSMGSTVPGSGNRAHSRTSSPQATLMEFVSNCLVRNTNTSGLLEVDILKGNGSAHSCTKEQVLLRVAGSYKELSSCPDGTSHLLESSPCSSDCAGRLSKPCWATHATNRGSQIPQLTLNRYTNTWKIVLGGTSHCWPWSAQSSPGLHMSGYWMVLDLCQISETSCLLNWKWKWI